MARMSSLQVARVSLPFALFADERGERRKIAMNFVEQRVSLFQGFMGKVLIDKLLRTCPGIENIYLLIRKKKGKDIHTRIEELFDDAVRMPVAPQRTIA